MLFNKQKELINMSGTLVKCIHAPLETFKNGKPIKSAEPYYQVTILIDDKELTEAQAVVNPFYINSSDEFKPKWLKGTADKSEDGRTFVNFKSRYDLKFFVPGQEMPLSYDDLVEHYGTTNGSIVTVSVKCKEGALYINALRFDEMKQVTVNDYFA